MYSYTVEMDSSMTRGEKRLREELKKEGFGVLTEIDVKKVLKEKLGVDVDRYKILGACNPQFSHRALELEKELGVLLPCNVIIYEEEGSVKAAAVRARRMLSIMNNPELEEVAEEVDERLQRALDRAAKG